MSIDSKIYDDFKGYNAYQIGDAEKIIRHRHSKNFSSLIEKIEGCEAKARDQRQIKILERILSVKNRMARMKKEVDERDAVFMTFHLKERLAQVDEEKLREIDFHVVDLMSHCEQILDSLTCSETDMHIIEKFSSINEYLREMEEHCHDRMKVFRKEILERD
ncbi:MAG: hypothetical protein A2W19_02810 [Spirochaetes bacterium RBG_16_49_21]|nr:MAG: hypothetical protein A2W19_02810 [Spirochaetes bacterium RBG_16_49_21]